VTTSPESESQLTPKQRYGELIDTFGAGWEKGDAEKIASIFTDDAQFRPMPFDAPAVGRPAIKAYWKDTPKEQAEIKFRSGEIYVAGPWFSTEFKCTFRRRRTGEMVDVRGALFCETADGMLSEMRMYWHRSVGRER
jgi:ketosteroid isomerase-like protein